MSSQRFPKKEHLKGRKLIQMLFRKGKAFSIYPIKVYYFLCSDSQPDVPVRAGFSVPVRHFKKAVNRNRIKRQMREVYRLQKQDLQQIADVKGYSITLFFIYTGRELPPFSLLFEKMNVSLNRVARIIQKEDAADATTE